MPNELEKLQDLHTKAQGKHNRAARAVLGHRKVSLGFATAGLRDLLIATDALDCDKAPAAGDLDAGLAAVVAGNAADRSDDPSILAKFGEALRVYARDVQLSRAQDKLLDATVKASIACFDKAIATYPTDVKQLPVGSKAAEEKAWLLAHRGAARMMIYWLGFTKPNATGDDKLFEQCKKQDFEPACRLKAQYTWCIQFNAFLHALRGKPGDSDEALELLEGLDPATRAKPTIQRSEAMLLSYNAAANSEKTLPERQQAARASLNAALNAQKDDQDEFLGAYSGAASSWALFDMAPGDLKGNSEEDKEKQRLLQDAQASCETAEIRARNAVSQALVALVGLTFVRGKIAQATGDHQALEAAGVDSRALQLLIKKSQFRDLESQAMVIRDPVWQAIKHDPVCSGYFVQPGFDELRNFTPPTEHSAI